MRSVFLPLIALLAFSAPASAEARSLYKAALATPVATSLVVKDVRWSCGGASCSAVRTGNSPDGNVCSAVVKKLGPVTAFSAGEKAFDPAQLEKCNAAAK